MDFLKKYWWALLLVVVVIWAYWYFMIKESKKPAVTTPKTGDCKKVTQTVFDAKVLEWKTAINADSAWKADVIARKEAGQTDDQAIEGNALYMVKVNDKLCV